MKRPAGAAVEITPEVKAALARQAAAQGREVESCRTASSWKQELQQQRG